MFESVAISGKLQVSASIFTGELDILLLYLRLEPLAWSQTLFGYFKGVENLLQGLMLILVLPFLKRKLRVCDTFLVMGGILSKVVGLAVMGLANTTWLVFAGESFHNWSLGLGFCRSELDGIC